MERRVKAQKERKKEKKRKSLRKCEQIT